MAAVLNINHQIALALRRIEADQVQAVRDTEKGRVPSQQAVTDALRAKLIEVGDYLREQGMLK